MGHSAKSEWEHQPADPDPNDDLDYEMIDWMCVEAEQQGREYKMFLPEEEEMLAEDEFILVERELVSYLSENV